MLLEFAVSNHRSFASEQTLSLIASGLKEKHPERIAIVDGPQKLEILTSAIVMGKNGSGKSSLVDAMNFVGSFIVDSAVDSQQGEEITRTPFKLDPVYLNMPSYYRVLFSMNTVIYQFSFSITSTRVITETLEIADKTVRFRKLYDRRFDDETGKYNYIFGESLRGDKSTWRQATRENALFFSTANQLNSEMLRQPFEWFSSHFKVIDAAVGSFTLYTSKHCENAQNKKNVIDLLKLLDIDVDDIEIEEEDINESLAATLAPEFLKRISQTNPSFGKSRKVRFVHSTVDGPSTALELSEESTGTKALFGLSGPLFDCLANGYCLVVDEINTSIHPLILQTLIEMFSDKRINRKRAQLIFTSHDTSVLRDSYFRRDQVWFVDKGRDSRSMLVPLSDYSPRLGEALDRGYLDGRYGGIPFIKSHFPMTEAESLWEQINS